MDAHNVALSRRPAFHGLSLLASGHAALQLLDLLTTYLALSNGGMEANPVSAGILATGGWPAYTALKAVMAAVFLAMIPAMRSFTPREARLGNALLGAFAVFMVAVVVNNALIAA